MLCYGIESVKVFHLNAQKHNVSLYVGKIVKAKNAKELLSIFDYGIGCIRIN